MIRPEKFRLLGAVSTLMAACSISAHGQWSDVALRFAENELAGRFEEANRLLQVPSRLEQFRDRPAFVPGKQQTLSIGDYQVVKALGALVTLELSGCERTWFGPVGRSGLTAIRAARNLSFAVGARKGVA